MNRRVALITASLLGVWLSASSLPGQHQTATFSPLVTEASLPYHIDLVPFDLGATPLPTLHSFAKAQWDGKWLLIGGRTNGLHAFTQNGFANFPPSFQNRDVWVIDPVNGESWQRSLLDAGLTVAQTDSLSVTNNQFYQSQDRLYLTGGYGVETDFDFVTFDTLTAIDVPGLMDWVQGADVLAAEQIRQIHDPLFTVTGGAMYEIDGRTHLVFGQDFQGVYTPFGNGVYTNQVRSFTIIDDGQQLSIQDETASDPDDRYRRRDLNVVPVIRSQADGSLSEELRVLSGVFTLEGGAWTVPVEISSDGAPSMADPADEDTFKQAMNTYHSAKIGLYSQAADEMHTLLFGGISLNFFDHATQEIVRDDSLPFINQATSIVIDGEGKYVQYLLPEEFPEIYDQESGNRLLFGTNAEFMLADGIATYENGVIQMDEIDGPTALGYILGGIAADRPNGGNTAASGRIFQVVYTPNRMSLGDLDQNGIVNSADIDVLNQNIREAQFEPRFDLDNSGQLDSKDLDYLIEVVFETWMGDANLDGEFNSSDLVSVFQAGEYEDKLLQNSRWETGDWTGDGEFDTSDFVSAFQAGGYENGPRTLAVPEPNSAVCLLGFIFIARLANRKPRVRAQIFAVRSPRTSR